MSIKKIIKEYLDMLLLSNPNTIIPNFQLIINISWYMRLKYDKYATEETISRKWREYRALLPEIEYGDKKEKLYKGNDKEYIMQEKYKGKLLYWYFTEVF